MKKALALVAVFAFPCAAFAGGIPQYDIKSYCHQVAELGGGGSAVIERECRKEEKASLERLRKMTLPERALRFCDEVSSVGGGGSYMILEECIKQEVEAEKDL